MNTIQLPQNQSDSAARLANVKKNQNKYRYKYDYQSLNGVAMADGVPCKEYPKFGWVKKVALTSFRLIRNVGVYNFMRRASFRFSKNSDSLLAKHPKQMSDYIRYFQTLDIPKITFSYQQDSLFANLRVAGQNPAIIERVEHLGSGLIVNDAVFKSVSGFAHDTLKKAVRDGRLFSLNYQKLELLQNGNSDGIQKYAYAPKALFAIPLGDSCLRTALLPIAIQCVQTAGADNPVYTPNDGVAWDMAKTVVQIADFNYHELISHLAATHLLIEPFVVTTNRQLADNHPLKVLLLPHFEGTIFINWAAQKSLVNDGGKVDTLFSGTIESSRKLVAERLTLLTSTPCG